MGSKCTLMALALVVCLWVMASLGAAQNIPGEFPADEMSGSVIRDEVGNGTDPMGDPSLSFRNESLFYTDRATGMRPGAVTRVPLSFAPIGGNWSFTLTGADTRYLNLALYQTADAVSGYGIIMGGGTTAQVTAGGTVLGDRLALFVTPVGSPELYRLSLTIDPGSMNGDFIYTAPGVTQPGIVSGKILAAPAVAAPVQISV